MVKPLLFLIPFLYPFMLISQNIQVSTTYGPVQGLAYTNGFQFLGIPFASPPNNELRWRPPQEPGSWTTPLPALDFKPACPQKLFVQGDTAYSLVGDEDCLYLNIWTPDTAQPDQAVMVFIHGGGNQQGSANTISMGTNMYDGKNLATRGNVVVVTLQYRLGVLGYMVHPGLEEENENNISGNYGVMDQLLALEWIKANISNFGGDTTRIMIFGESAGGVNVGNLMVCPQAEGLFHRACIQSAVPSLGVYEDAKEKGIDFVNDFIAQGSDSAKISFMRSVPADSITILNESPLSGGMVQMNWRPVMDSYLFPEFPEVAVQTGDFNNVPLMIGSNADEMSVSAPAVVYPFMVTALINSIFPPGLQQDALTMYPPGNTNEEARKSYVQLLTDSQFTATSRRTAQCVSLNQNEPVFRYFFTHKQAGPLDIYGSYHGLELFYIFNNYENTNYAWGPWYTGADDSVQQMMLEYWTSFAKYGIPAAQNFAIWPAFLAEQDCYLEIKSSPDGSQCGLRTEKCDLWDAVINYQGCTSSIGMPETKHQSPLVYPNPAHSYINIPCDDPPASRTIVLYDSQGKRQLEIKRCGLQYIGHLPSGIYFIKIIENQNVIVSRFIKQ